MNIAARSTLAVLVGYLVILIGVGFWLERDYRKTSMDTMSDTAALIADHLSAALHETVVDRLAKREFGAKQDLRETIVTLVERSKEITSLDVVDADGNIIVDESGDEQQLQLPTAETVFSGDRSIKVDSDYEGRFTLGRHVLLMPIVHDGALLGYFRIDLNNRSIAHLAQQLTNRFIVIAVTGLLALVVLGLLLQLELTRLGRGLTELLQNWHEDDNADDRLPAGSFADTREAAKSLGGKLRRAQNDLNILTRLLKVGVVQLDANDELDFISQEAMEMLGIESAQSSADIDEHFEEYRQALKAPLQRMKEQQLSDATIDINVPAAGQLRQLRIELISLDSEQWRGCLVLLKDRDTIDALDADLRAATQLRSLSNLYVGAAHDLRAPLSAIVMNFELLKRSLDADGSEAPNADRVEERSRYLSVLTEELMRLQRFLTSFLEQASPNASSVRESLELTTLLVEVGELLANQADRYGIELKTSLPSVPVHISGSNDQIRQAVVNVLINAFEAMPNGGTVTASLETMDGRAVIKICDTGGGIPSTLIDRVFDMHFTTKASGSGIGLYVVRSIIEQHGGKVRINSELGEGSCICLELPIETKSEVGE